MNYQHLRYFQAVAKEENYLRASEKLYITQSALSRAIASLEEELGASLFEKSGRNVRITPYGAKFLQYVDQAMETIDRGVEEIQYMMNRLEGTISVACIYGYTYGYLPDLISQYNVTYPNVRFQIKPTTTQDVIFSTHMGNYDMGFHSESALMKKYLDLDYYEVRREEVVVIVPVGHPFAGRKSCRLAELKDERFVSFDGNSGMLYKIRDMFTEADLTFTPYITVTDDQSIVNMVKSGMACACVLRNIAKNNVGFSILTIEDKIDKYLGIYLTVRRKPVYPATVSSFLEFILQHSKEKTPAEL